MHNATIGASAQAQDDQSPLQFLTFHLGQELFGLSILGIKEIIEYRAPTPVPSMPSCVRGVINLRGAVVPIVDLQLRLGRAANDVTRRSCVVIVTLERDGADQAFGLLVDAVSEVMDIAPQQIEAAPSFGSGIRGELMQGVGKLEDRLVILLERRRLLQVDDIAEAALPAAA